MSANREIALNAGKGIVVVDGFHALHLYAEPLHLPVGRKLLRHVAHHVFHKGGAGKGTLGDEFFIFALEQGVDGGRSRFFGNVDEIL